MTNRFVQAYRQAPWRSQFQWIVVFLLALVLLAFVAGIYLTVSEHSATTGREIQQMSADLDSLDSQIADMKTQLAALTSATQMEKRAEAMGFTAIDPATATYLIVPGYVGRQPVVLAPAPGAKSTPASLIRSNYTESLWEWMFQGFLSTQAATFSLKP
jgi:hypothetical protein